MELFENDTAAEDEVPPEAIEEIAQTATVEVMSDEEALRTDPMVASQRLRAATSGRFKLSRLKRTSKNRTDKAIILQMALHGHDCYQIAEVLGQEQEWVSKMLMEAMRDCAPVEKIEELRQIELKKLDLREQEAWDDYMRSGEDELITTVKETYEGTETTTRRKPQVRSAVYQKVLNDIAIRRASILGLDRPHKVQIAESRQLHIIETVVTSREEVLQLKNAGLLK